MKNALKVLLVGVTVSSSIIAINKNTSLNQLKAELASKQKENKKLTNELENSSNDLIALNQKNKKLSKRVVNEINKIISLKDSVDNLDENLKKDQKKLAQKSYWTKRLLREKRQLKKEIQEAKESEKQNKQTSQAKQKRSYSKKLNVTNIKTTLMRKKFNGSFVKTINVKKVDAIKTNFKILNDETATSGKKKVTISVFNSRNKKLAFNDVLEVDYKNEKLDVTSIIEVEREKIEKGTYNIVAYIDGKEVNSSFALIN